MKYHMPLIPLTLTFSDCFSRNGFFCSGALSSSLVDVEHSTPLPLALRLRTLSRRRNRACATSGISGPSSTSDSTNLPRTVGADAVPDLALPKTVVSTVDSLVGAGGVVQSSPDN